MIIAVGPLVLALGAALVRLWDAGWMKPHEAFDRLKMYLLGWAEGDQGIGGDVPEYVAVYSQIPSSTRPV